MSNSTRLNQRNAVASVRDLLDQLIAEVPQNQPRSISQKAKPTQASKPKSAELDRLFAYIEGKAKK